MDPPRFFIGNEMKTIIDKCRELYTKDIEAENAKNPTNPNFDPFSSDMQVFNFKIYI